ncbi:chemotaxis protein CheW [mine drainage metagenome]|uniref:Chemotaxis protein CheW n=1 Tax=mine drainage metagenome TaxID=410659 RepID=A0A1J5RTS5_9ZZZZ
MTGLPTPAPDPSRQFVTLGVGADLFAVDVRSVREILDMRPLAHIPNAPSYLLGLIDVRGRGVPVIDLRLKLGLAPAPPGELTRILVLDTDLAGQSRVVGLLVDRVFEVTALDDRSVAPPPEIGRRWRSEYIAGIGRRHGSFVIILVLDRLLTGDEPALLAGENTAPAAGEEDA